MSTFLGELFGQLSKEKTSRANYQEVDLEWRTEFFTRIFPDLLNLFQYKLKYYEPGYFTERIFESVKAVITILEKLVVQHPGSQLVVTGGSSDISRFLLETYAAHFAVSARLELALKNLVQLNREDNMRLRQHRHVPALRGKRSLIIIDEFAENFGKAHELLLDNFFKRNILVVFAIPNKISKLMPGDKITKIMNSQRFFYGFQGDAVASLLDLASTVQVNCHSLLDGEMIIKTKPDIRWNRAIFTAQEWQLINEAQELLELFRTMIKSHMISASAADDKAPTLTDES